MPEYGTDIMKVVNFKSSFSCIFFFVTSTTCQVLDQFDWEYLRTKSSFFGPLEVPGEPGNSVQVVFIIRMAVQKCCPIVLIQTTPIDKLLKEKECLDIQEDILPSLFVWKHYISLDLMDAKKSDYHYNFENDRKHYRIGGRHETNFADISVAKLYIFYPCFNKQPLSFEVKYSISVKNVTNLNSICTKFENSSPCAKYYSKWSLPNILGNTEPSQAGRSISVFSGLASSECHQHVMETMCRMIFPKCSEKYALYN